MIDVNLPVELDDGRPARYIPLEEAIELGKAFGPENYEDGVALFEIVGNELRNEPTHSTTNHWWYDLDTGRWNGGNEEDYYVLRNVADERDYERDI